MKQRRGLCCILCDSVERCICPAPGRPAYDAPGNAGTRFSGLTTFFRSDGPGDATVLRNLSMERGGAVLHVNTEEVLLFLSII